MQADVRRVVGDIVVEPVITVRERAFRMREDRSAVDVGQAVERRIPVGGEEVVPGPGREIDDFALEEVRAHQSAGGDGGRPGRSPS